MTLKRWWRCASLGLVCLLASGCWASFPENLLSEEAGANDGGVDRPADTPGVETAVPEGGPDTTRDGGLGDGTVDSTSDLPQPDGPVSDSTVDGQPPDSTVDTTPSDSTVDSDPCAGQSCPLGCNASAARCNRLDPSNFNVASVYGQLTFDADATNNTTFNTDTGEVRAGLNLIRSSGGPGTVKNGIYWAVVTQGGGAPQIGVFAMRSLRVRSGTTLDFEGGNAAAIYTAGPINIEGTVRARAVARIAGPGGYDGGLADSDGQACFNGQGRDGNTQGSNRESGGGGGGRRSNGGSGGSATGGSGASGGGAGMANGSFSLVPLYGGCGGGGGARSAGGAGGGGGGAIQLSADGTISITGTVTAPGAGGRGNAVFQAGGGGGSGGAILIEGHAITVTGIVAANGGGGGGGGSGNGHGQDGQASTSRANGGNGSTGGNGGQGGARAVTGGSNGQSDDYNGGGGGGSAGRVRFNAPSQTAGANDVSPSPSTSNTVSTF